jgi:hypothetical protein
MKSPVKVTRFLAIAILLSSIASAQQSDYAVKKGFEEGYASLLQRVETATAVGTLDSLKGEVDAFEQSYAPHAGFLDKVIYPETFADRIRSLRTMHSLTYERVYLITTQGVKIEELQTKIVYLTTKLDTLTAQRERLLEELAQAKRSNSQLRDIIKRLQANTAAKDRLIFALVDSIFLPYAREQGQTNDLQKEAIARKLEQANILARIEEVAGENAQFVSSTQLQPKDYPGVVEQYQQFANRWNGLREKLTAAMLSGTRYAPQGMPAAGRPQDRGTAVKQPSPPETPGARVDSLLLLWGNRLQARFWDGLAKEFSTNGVSTDPFSDGPTFAASVRACIARLKTSGEDPTPLVEKVWKGRIDREWRDALMKSSLLGPAEYAALDREISQLSQPGVDTRFLIYSGVVILLAIAGWWFFVRKPKAPGTQGSGTDGKQA